MRPLIAVVWLTGMILIAYAIRVRNDPRFEIPTTKWENTATCLQEYDKPLHQPYLCS